MGLFYTSDAEKKALEIENKLHYIRDAYPLYDEKAIPFLQKWTQKERPIDKQYTDAKDRRDSRRVNLILIQEMKQAEKDFVEKKDFKKLVDVSVKSEQAFYGLAEALKDVNLVLMLDAKLALVKELPSRVNDQNKNDGDWIAREVADGYAALGPDYIDKCTDALNAAQKKSSSNHFRRYAERALEKEKEGHIPTAANFMLAALKINPRMNSPEDISPHNKAYMLLQFKNKETQLALAEGMIKNARREDKNLAETLLHCLDPRYIEHSQKDENILSAKAVKALIDPKGIDILNKDATERFGNLTEWKEKTVKQYFLETVRKGIISNKAFVIDAVMPDLATLDKFIVSHNEDALASEGKIESLNYHNLIPSSGNQNNMLADAPRNKLMQLVFDEKIKDKYQAGQPQSEEMQATMTLLGDLAGDVLMGGRFDQHDSQKRAAVEMIKKMILLENAHKLEGKPLDVMKGNRGETPVSTEMPEFEGEGAKILKLMTANPDFYYHQEAAKKLNDELKTHVMTLRQAQSPVPVIKSRYDLKD
jgi:hypothetical protein